MSTVVQEVVDAETSRRWLKLGATAIAGVLVLVLAGLGLRWWTHPTLFGGLGDTFFAKPRPVAEASLSSTVIFPNVHDAEETITFKNFKAVFSNNTAEAKATFSICHLSAGEMPIGAVHDPEEYCRDIVPAGAGAAFHYDRYPDGDYLFVTITPTRAGAARLARVEVTYARGRQHLYQRGTESIRVDRKVTAK